MSDPIPLAPACFVCHRRGIPMTWWMPVVPYTDGYARAYCRRKVCQADLERWGDRLMFEAGRNNVYWRTEPCPPDPGSWMRPIMEWGRQGTHPRRPIE
jgi:hypothetical protein